LTGFLDYQLIAARLGRLLELPIRGILQMLLRPEHADQLFGLVVIGSKVVVGDGPVETLAVAAVRLEVVGAHAK